MKLNAILILSGLLFATCGSSNAPEMSVEQAQAVVAAPKNLDGLAKAYFASGCFWCVEAVYESVRGVEEVVSGYSGGEEPNPTYHQVGSGNTGHAEAVEVYYDPNVVSFATLVEVFYGSQDPTTVGQKPDYGSQYRSIIFYTTDEEKGIAEAVKADAQLTTPGKVVTEILPFEKFWIAEEYHQDYEKLNPNQPYVVGVSIPRLNKFKQKHPELVK
jgi:peptide-methionine (S)-S-oxide reductase